MVWVRKPSKKQFEDDRDYDTTSLRQNALQDFIHRDYAAHFFRWGFATRFIKGGMNVLDIGCGPDQAMVRIMCRAPGMQPRKMIGVDYGKVKPRWNFKWFELRAQFDFVKSWKQLSKDGPFDVITCFEVIEHMQKTHGKKLLKGAHELLSKDGVFLLSTPVFDGKQMAQNHIHEYYRDELLKEIKAAGFDVYREFGTFQTSMQAKKAKPAHLAVWKELRAYYSDDVLACFLAPLYPEHSRNICWVLKRR